QRSVRETGIRWYVAHPDDPNVWPAEFRDQPAFESTAIESTTCSVVSICAADLQTVWQSHVVFTRRSAANVERSLSLICKHLRNPQSIFTELTNCAVARCAKYSIWVRHCCLSSRIGSPHLT